MRPPATDLRVFVDITNSEGQTVAKQEHWPEGELFLPRNGLQAISYASGTSWCFRVLWRLGSICSGWAGLTLRKDRVCRFSAPQPRTRRTVQASRTSASGRRHAMAGSARISFRPRAYRAFGIGGAAAVNRWRFHTDPPISVDFGDRVCCFLPLRFFVSLKAATPLSA